MRINTLFFCLAFLMAAPLWSQGSLLPLGNPAYHTLRRMDVLSENQSEIHTALRGYLRGSIVSYTKSLDSTFSATALDELDYQFIFLDNNDWLLDFDFPTTLGGPRMTSKDLQNQLQGAPYWQESKKPFLKHFYKTPAHFFEVNEPGFSLRLNPMLNLQYGNLVDDPAPYFLNQRGIELRGSIDDRIHFYTNIIESQARFPNYASRFINTYRALPGNGFYKTNFGSDILNFSDGYDFLNSQAYLAFNVTPHVGVQFGNGRHFIGDGIRSMLLSDFSNNYLYLQLNWKVWKLHFQNIFAELNSTSAQNVTGNGLVPKKYMAAHYLSLQLHKNLQFGLFETVIFSRENQFELQYLNPVILYRTIEQSVGSPDNVLIGLNLKWNAWNKFQVYSQFILDEFKFSELVVNQDGWWGNKYGFQLGIFAPNLAGVDHLDVQVEYNTARPYTYTHFDSVANYTHYNMPLSHPLGANFKETIALVKYQPFPRWYLELRYSHIDYGGDVNGLNYGRDWRRSYNSRILEYGNETGQGLATSIDLLHFDLSFNLAHNVFLDLRYLYRSEANTGELNTQYISTGIRVNMARRYDAF